MVGNGGVISGSFKSDLSPLKLAFPLPLGSSGVVEINGPVKGEVHASESLELAEAARIEGDIYYKVLEMAAGAQINGKMVYQAEAPRQLPRPEILAAEA